MPFGQFSNVTHPYSFMEAWFYDTFIAPAGAAFYSRLDKELPRDLPSGTRFLDVGCGGGQFLCHLARTRPGWDLAGLDLSPGQVSRANRRLKRLGSQAKVWQGSALSLPFEGQSFDLVMSVGSIKHWPDQAKGLAECARVLKSGGRMAVVEADRGCRTQDMDRLFKPTRMPRVFRLPFRVFFRNVVAGSSLDRDDMRSLARQLPLKTWEVTRLEGLPLVHLDGIKE